MSGLNKLVVARNSAVLGLPYPLEDVNPVPESDHSSICKFTSRSQRYEQLVSAISDLLEWVTGDPSLMRRSMSSGSELSDDGTSSSSNWAFKSDLALPGLASPQMPSSPPSGTVRNPGFHGVPVVRKPIPSGNLATEVKEAFGHDYIPTKSTDRGPHYLLPSIATTDFTGRKTVLDRIKELLEKPNPSRPIAVAIYGLGGVGKTQVALQLLDWYKGRYPDRSIFWLHAGNADLMRQSLTEIGLHSGIVGKDSFRQPLDLVREFLLNPSNGRWLAIIDNTDTLDGVADLSGQQNANRQSQLPLRMMLAHYVPRCAHGQIFFTTRSKSIGEKLTNQGHVIEVGPMDNQDSHELLRKQICLEQQPTGNPPQYQKEVPSDDALERLCTHLNHIPLVLSQAAAFIRQNNLTISEYLQLIEQDESLLSDVLEQDFLQLNFGDRWSRAVAIIWNKTFDQIQASAPEADNLLAFIAFLDPQKIPRTLLQAVVDDRYRLTVTALGTLQSYALLNAGSEHDTFNMHLLVQLAVRRRLERLGSAKEWLIKALDTLAEQFPRGGYDVWPTCAALLPHALQILKHMSMVPPKEMPIQIVLSLETKIGAYYVQQGFFAQALEMSQQALQSATVGSAPSKELEREVKDLEADALKNMGHLEEAETVAKEVWLERQHSLGAKHVDTLKSYNYLALIYQEQGKLREAAKIARWTLKSLQKTQPDDDFNVLDSKRRLGTILHKLGEYEEAENLMREALDGFTQKGGAEDITTSKAKWRLAWILHSRAKYEEARRTNEDNWAVQKRILGEHHRDVVKTLYLLADDLQALGELDLALRYKRRVYERATALLGADQHYTLMTAASLASGLVAAAARTKDPEPYYEEAERMYKRVLAGREKQLIADHAEHTLGARTDVATMHRLRGRPAAAEPLERETLKKLKLKLDELHPLALASRESLARALWAQRESRTKAKEAIKQARKLLMLSEKRLGWNHPDTHRRAELLMEMLAEGKEKEALEKKVASERRTEKS